MGFNILPGRVANQNTGFHLIKKNPLAWRRIGLSSYHCQLLYHNDINATDVVQSKKGKSILKSVHLLSKKSYATCWKSCDRASLTHFFSRAPVRGVCQVRLHFRLLGSQFFFFFTIRQNLPFLPRAKQSSFVRKHVISLLY